MKPGQAAVKPGPADGEGAARGGCDYLLVAGPGRSGSTFLLRILAAQRGFETLDVRDGCYYRSRRRFDRALRRARAADRRAVLVDVANAWRDPGLADGIGALASRGRRVLIVVLLRDPRDRAVSSMRFRRSRGEPAALLGARALERAVIRDSLTPERLGRIHRLPADVLTVGFSALTGDTDRFLDVLAGLCGTARFERAPRHRVNESVDARHLLLSAAGKLAAVVLRRAGFPALLERLKASPRVQRFFFRPRAAGRGGPRLGGRAERALAGRLEACLAVVEAEAERLGDGIWLKRAGERPARKEPADAGQGGRASRRAAGGTARRAVVR